MRSERRGAKRLVLRLQHVCSSVPSRSCELHVPCRQRARRSWTAEGRKPSARSRPDDEQDERELFLPALFLSSVLPGPHRVRPDRGKAREGLWAAQSSSGSGPRKANRE